MTNQNLEPVYYIDGSDPDAVVPAISDSVSTASQIPTTSPMAAGSVGGDGGLGGLMTNPYGTISSFTVMDLVQMFVVYAFIIAAALSAIFIFVGGVSFILSGGSEEKIKQAVNTIRYSIVGLIITILSFTFVAIVGRMFGLNFLSYLSYDQIKNSINRLISTGEKPVDGFRVPR